MNQYDVVILGAGPAGLMCGLQAAQRGRKVVILDHGEQVGRKILISGGGHCNFTNRVVTGDNYFSHNPAFAKSALSRFGPQDFLEMLHRHRLAYEERTHGRLFCSGPARQIVNMLVADGERAGVTLYTLSEIVSVVRREDRFVVAANCGNFTSESLVVATGGKSFPNSGATDLGYRLARQFGHTITELTPALIGLTVRDGTWYRQGQLAGISLPGSITCQGHEFSDEILFTHEGISGPAVLSASLYWQKDITATVNLAPHLELAVWVQEQRCQNAAATLAASLSRIVPKRLAMMLCDYWQFTRPIAALPNTRLSEMSLDIHAWTIRPEIAFDYDKAEVTRGGVDTTQLSSKTMESKKVPGLFFIGEVVDVTGQLGGYNLHWAWASGHAAGAYV